MSVCPKCKAENSEGVKFCRNCGSPISDIRCPGCQAINPPGTLFCGSCGKSLSQEVIPPTASAQSQVSRDPSGYAVARMVIGIISIVLSLIIFLQSCAVMTSNALNNVGQENSSAGYFMAVLMLIGGILGIAGRRSRNVAILVSFFYLTALLPAAGAKVGEFSDLYLWIAIDALFFVAVAISVFAQKRKK